MLPCPAMLRRSCDIPCPALLDLCDVELQEVVKPCNQLLPMSRRLSAYVDSEGAAKASKFGVAAWDPSYLDSPIVSCVEMRFGGEVIGRVAMDDPVS